MDGISSSREKREVEVSKLWIIVGYCTTMEEFKEAYKQLCRKYHSTQSELILSYLKCIGDNRISLDLSTCNIPITTCFVLGKALSMDSAITDLYFCDCMLSCEGIKLILEGLCTNSCVKHLHLKGNSLKGSSAEDLSKLLTFNYSLYHLSLEWNCLGKNHKFTLLCAGLASNTALKILDLRSNQICNESAIALASSLSRNCVLQSLDLRWNMIGHTGACALLNVLQNYNKTLMQLDLAGNSGIPCEVVKAISKALSNNCAFQLIQEEHIKKTKQISSEMKNLFEEKTKQAPVTATTDESQSSQKLKKLEEALHEKKLAYEALLERANHLQTLLKTAEEENKEISEIAEKRKSEIAELKDKQQQTLLKENKERVDAEANLIAQMDAIKEDKRHLELELESALRIQQLQNDKNQKLQENVESLEAKLKMIEIMHTEQMEVVRQKHKETLNNMEEQRQQNVTKMKRDLEEVEKSLNKSFARLETQRIQFEKEIFQLNGKLMEEKAKTEELLQQQRVRFQTEAEEHYSQLNEKFQTLQQEKDSQMKTIAHLNFEITTLQSEKSQLETGKENLLKTTQFLQQQLTSKDEEVRHVACNLETEIQQRKDELQREKQSQVSLQRKITQLEETIKELQMQNSETTTAKDREITNLKEILSQKEKDIVSLQEDEVQRASRLSVAFKSYLTGVPHPSSPSHSTGYHLDTSNCSSSDAALKTPTTQP